MTPMRRHVLGLAIAGAFMVVGGPAALAQQGADKPAAKSEPIYGYRMMSPEERDEYRAKMRNAGSVQERQAIRDEHHAAMVERAKERGITLPDRPTGAGPRGPGMGAGQGMGPDGTGPRGPGMGPGRRMGPPDGPRGPGYGPRTQ